LARCPKCGHNQIVKAGKIWGKQRWKCKGCGYQFTRDTPRGRPIWQRQLSWSLTKYDTMPKKACKLWIWKAIDRDRGQLLDWECGNRDTATLKKMVNRLEKWDVTFYCTDKWEAYASVFPPEKLIMDKSITHEIERNNCRNRHWFGRFKRKSIVVTKSDDSGRFDHVPFRPIWVNGDASEIFAFDVIT
jgi:insertion element IS1 protein InsB